MQRICSASQEIHRVLGNTKNQELTGTSHNLIYIPRPFGILSTVRGEKQTRKLEALDRYVKQMSNSGNCKDKKKTNET